ncbi:MAG: anthranilate synthase component I family protein [Syntrophomonadaceae bacterium]|nr:anthranilate synthase component I family protein [Syntrophomonadaceae bacterium]
MFIYPLTMEKDLISIYSTLDRGQDSFWLDSSMQHNELGRYSFLGVNPIFSLRSKGEVLEWREEGGWYATSGNPLAFIDSFLQDYEGIKEKLDNYPFPFAGGLVGYLAYDLKNQIERDLIIKNHPSDVYDQYWGVYDTFLVEDHLLQQKYIVGPSQDKIDKLKDLIETNFKNVNHDNYISLGKLRSNLTKDEYIEKINKVKNSIKTGELEQINLSQVFTFPITGNPLNYYKILRKVSPSYFGAFLHYPEYDVISISPERFIQIKDNKLQTKPIKGTRPRGENAKEDEKYRQELANSSKEKKELKLIVDMECSNLESISIPGTVKVSDLYNITAHPTIFHLDATIDCTLKPHISYEEILRATFPGSSITGRPKRKAFKIIEELEPVARGIYTGSIGYIDFRGNSDLSVAIRTTLVKEGIGYYHAGGGLTIDSNPEEEYQETWDKVKAVLLVQEEVKKGD